MQFSLTERAMRSRITVDKNSLFFFSCNAKAQLPPTTFPLALLGAVGVQIVKA